MIIRLLLGGLAAAIIVLGVFLLELMLTAWISGENQVIGTASLMVVMWLLIILPGAALLAVALLTPGCLALRALGWSNPVTMGLYGVLVLLALDYVDRSKMSYWKNLRVTDLIVLIVVGGAVGMAFRWVVERSWGKGREAWKAT